MNDFENLKLAHSEVVSVEKWNALVQELEATSLRIDPTSLYVRQDETVKPNGVTKKLVIDDNGYVGIGTHTPQTRLHIFHDNHHAALRIEGDNRHITVESDEIYSTGQALHINSTTNNNVLLVNGGGRVGVGTRTPEKPLHVVSRIGDSGLKISAKGLSTNIYLHVAKGNYGYLDLGGATRLRGNSGLSEFNGRLNTGQLRIKKVGRTKGWLIMEDYANSNAAKNMLRTMKPHQAIFAGAWDTGIYFYWNDKSGKPMMLRLGGKRF